MSRPTTPPNENSTPISSSAFGQVRAYLAQRGYSQEWLDTTLGVAAAGRNRKAIADILMGAL